MKVKFLAILCLLYIVKMNASDMDSTKNMNHYLDEVLVTSYKENEALKDAPVSASVFSPMRLNAMSIYTSKDLTALVPNLFMPEYGSKLTSPVFIRGIGATTNSPAVGLYVDGIPYFERGLYDIALTDVQSVEVLRGPQGTLYGRNTLGGIINVHTRSPFDFKGNRLSMGAGTKGQGVLDFVNYTPLSKALAFSINLKYNHRDGFFRNVTRNENSGKLDDLAGRFKLSYKPSDKILIELVQNTTYSKQNGYPYAHADSTSRHHALHIEANDKSGYEQTVSSTGLSFKYKMEGMLLSSLTSYQWFGDRQRIDQDFTAAPLFYSAQKMNQNLGAEEINLKSDNRSNYQWIVGIFGFVDGLNNSLDVSYLQQHATGTRISGENTTSLAFYHQSVYHHFLLEGLSLGVGIRYDYEHSSMNCTGNMVPPFDNSLHSGEFVPKADIQYRINEGNQLYFSLAKGYKAGGFNTYFEKEADKSFGPETSLNYELGYKFDLLKGMLSGDLTAFYIDWKNIQVSVTDPSYVNNSTPVVRNLGKAVSKGIELSLLFTPCRNLSIDNAYGYTHATFRKNPNPALDGKNLSMVPQHTLSSVLNKTFPCSGWLDKIVFSLKNVALGPIYWNPQNADKQNFYDVLSSRLSFYRKNISFALWADNITNTNYDTYYFTNAQLGLFTQQGRPVTGGVDFSVYF